MQSLLANKEVEKSSCELGTKVQMPRVDYTSNE